MTVTHPRALFLNFVIIATAENNYLQKFQMCTYHGSKDFETHDRKTEGWAIVLSNRVILNLWFTQ